jgi:hypothetical protein
MLQSAQNSAAPIMSGAFVNDGETEETRTTGNGETQDMRSPEAQDEFEQFAQKAASAPTKQPIAPMDSSDEEEATALLMSEFQSMPKPDTTEKFVTETNNDDEIDDLAMAITKKKKKTKKQK